MSLLGECLWAVALPLLLRGQPFPPIACSSDQKELCLCGWIPEVVSSPLQDSGCACKLGSFGSYFLLLQEEKAKAYKKEKQREKKRRAEEDLSFEEDDEMAAVMGFSGFGSTKKSH